MQFKSTVQSAKWLVAATLVSLCAPSAYSQCEVSKIVESDAGPNFDFGFAVSLEGDVLMVGGRRRHDERVYVYQWNGIEWTEEQRIDRPNGLAHRFGEAISLSGDRAIIGAAEQRNGVALDAGAVYSYRRVGGTWVEEAVFMASDPATGERFGRTISLDGNVALIGVSLVDCADGENCGAAYVFRYDGTDWIEEAKLTDPAAAASDGFGGSVSLDGDVALIGATQTDCPAGIFCGVAYVFRFNGSDWVEEARLTGADTGPTDRFGSSVSLDANIAVVSATGDDCPDGGACGAAYVFRFNGSNWVEEAKFTSPERVEADRFGRAVAAQGNTLVVTSLDKFACGSMSGCGAGYLFHYNGVTWDEAGKLVASDLALGGFFGFFDRGVAISGDLVAIGAYRAPCGASQCGAVYTSLLNGPDCDDNGTFDLCELHAGSATDCNGNDFPDNCEPDADGDTVIDACDICPGHNDFLDRDGDGVPDGCDGCPDDENKTDPGQCGCGRLDTGDTDGDGVLNCIDLCNGVDDAVFGPECDGAIPTVSQWGLIVLTMLLLVAAKLSFRRPEKRWNVSRVA